MDSDNEVTMRDGESLVSEMGPIDGPFLSRTRRAGIRLNHEGFSYYKERARGQVTYWRCSDKKCRGRVVQRSNTIIRTKEHKHPARNTAIELFDTFVSRVTDESGVYSGMPSPELRIKDTVSAHYAFNSATPSPTGDSPAIALDTISGPLESSMDTPSPVADTQPEMDNPYPAHIFLWNNETGEEVDMKPDIRQLEKLVNGRVEIGVNTDSDGLLEENRRLRMKIRQQEMEMQRYKDTIRRIRADLDILDVA